VKTKLRLQVYFVFIAARFCLDLKYLPNTATP